MIIRCPECGNDLILISSAIDASTNTTTERYVCENCDNDITYVLSYSDEVRDYYTLAEFVPSHCKLNEFCVVKMDNAVVHTVWIAQKGTTWITESYADNKVLDDYWGLFTVVDKSNSPTRIPAHFIIIEKKEEVTPVDPEPTNDSTDPTEDPVDPVDDNPDPEPTYVGEEYARNIALSYAGANPEYAEGLNVALTEEPVYEVSFDFEDSHYTYWVGAVNGDILYIETYRLPPHGEESGTDPETSEEP